MKPHKHAGLIKQWADGAEIEWFSWGGVWEPLPHPRWDITTKYRIKPEPPVVVPKMGDLCLSNNGSTDSIITFAYMDDGYYRDTKGAMWVKCRPHPLQVERDALYAALKDLEPYLDRLICYASTPAEYEPNAIVKRIVELLKKGLTPYRSGMH